MLFGGASKQEVIGMLPMIVAVAAVVVVVVVL